MGINAGRLRRRASFQRQTTTQDSFGEQEASWTEIANQRVGVEPLNGRELLGRTAEQSQVTTRLRARYSAALDVIAAHDRIVVGGDVYSIEAPPINPKQMGRNIIFMCSLTNRGDA